MFRDHKNEFGLFTPFGPAIGYYKIPEKIIKCLNSLMDDKLSDFSEKLVGKVSFELEFNEECKKCAAEGLSPFIFDYKMRNSKRLKPKQTSTLRISPFNLRMMSGWFVRQYATEYNPLHVHADAHISCVGYLKIPAGMEEEWKKDSQDHHPAHGQIQFTHGTTVPEAPGSLMVKPEVGDFFIFPGTLYHCVYPFYGSGERRSFSMNFQIISDEKGGSTFF